MNAAAFVVDYRDDLEKGIDASGLRWTTHLHSLITWIDFVNMKEIQRSAIKFLEKIDIISIDLDGQDDWILHEMDRGSVSIIVLENNSLFGPNSSITIPRDKLFTRNVSSSKLFWGASLRAFINLLEPQGFTFVGSNLVGNNAFFVRKELARLIKIKIPNTFNLSNETDYLIRESIGIDGALNFLSKEEAIMVIKGAIVYDTELGKERKFNEP